MRRAQGPWKVESWCAEGHGSWSRRKQLSIFTAAKESEIGFVQMGKLTHLSWFWMVLKPPFHYALHWTGSRFTFPICLIVHSVAAFVKPSQRCIALFWGVCISLQAVLEPAGFDGDEHLSRKENENAALTFALARCFLFVRHDRRNLRKATRVVDLAPKLEGAYGTRAAAQNLSAWAQVNIPLPYIT